MGEPIAGDIGGGPRLAPGEQIFAEGSDGRHMYIVLEGEVRILKQTAAGAAEIGRVGVGAIFGELALVSDLKRSATAIAGDSGALLLGVDQARFVHLISQQPAFALFVIQALGRRIKELDDRVSAMQGAAQ